jgi:hypothetical protein
MADVVPSELEVARAVAEGTLPSPSFHCGNAFFALRISGTGVSWRKSRDEFVYRPSDVWLSDTMQDRVRGLPVIVMHPDDGTLDGDELAQRIIGTVVHSYTKDDELWGIARVIDAGAAAAMQEHGADTSPSVVLTPGSSIMLELGDDERLLIEDSPALVDHVAVVAQGVWSKGGSAGDGVLTEGHAT